MLGIGISMSIGGGTQAFVPSLLSPFAWYDPSDVSTLFQDAAGTTPITASGQPVRRMNDISGNGFHLIAPSDPARPTYQTAGGLHWLESDGVDDVMSVAMTGLTGDHTAGAAVRVTGLGNSNHCTFSFDATNDYQVESGSATEFFSRFDSANLGIGFLNPNIDYVNTDIVQRVTLAATPGTGAMAIDGTDEATSNLYNGALDAAQTFRIFSSRTGGTFLAMRFYGFVGTSAVSGLAGLDAWLAAKQGRTL